MDDDLLGVGDGWTRLEDCGVVSDEHGHTSPDNEGRGIRRRTVFVDDPGVGPERKERRVPTCL